MLYKTYHAFLEEGEGDQMAINVDQPSKKELTHDYQELTHDYHVLVPSRPRDLVNAI
jgi:hypothetical protein